MSLSTPVVLILFNRPNLVRAVFSALAQVKPRKLLVVADGPRFHEEKQKCEEARAVIQNVDWECEIRTNFSEINLGCRRRVVSGLNWAFSLVEEAIILEDDCVPHHSFFEYCETLLDYYRDDERIMEVSGCNYGLDRVTQQCSYYFSKYYHTLGWATWKRAWKLYDESISAWPELKRRGFLKTILTDEQERYWTAIFDRLSEGQLGTSWDYQWQLARWRHNGLAAVPSRNLVSNIGFGLEATNTKWETDFRASLPVYNIGAICHPPFVLPNQEADRERFMNERMSGPNIWWKIRHKVRKLRAKLRTA